MQKILLLLIASCLISGCQQRLATERIELVSIDASHDQALKTLTQTANIISKDLNELKALEKIVAPLDKQEDQRVFSAIKEQLNTELEWVGPVETLLKMIAKRYHYTFKVLGRTPAIPILINLWIPVNTPLSEVMYNIHVQLGQHAHLKYYTESGVPVIELCYAS